MDALENSLGNSRNPHSVCSKTNGPLIVEAQTGDPFPIDDSRSSNLFEYPLRQGTVLTDGFDFEKMAIGSKAYGPEISRFSRRQSNPKS
uniref:Uncharacterized protein n=1 Tax=Candidatus Kentrum sp. LFY TaxID=2126342 RepID=A0A450X0F8_9GAMM|nr:MAG: hypothetical protein BECKLFY1418C_GA0070996_11267 [Candidatus Kentron sp. LFY]